MKFDFNTVMQGIQMAQMFTRAQDPTQQAAAAVNLGRSGVRVARGGGVYKRATVANLVRVLVYTAILVVFHHQIILKGTPGAIYECLPYAFSAFVVISGYAWALKQSPIGCDLKGSLILTAGYSIAVASLLCALSMFAGHAFELDLLATAFQISGDCIVYLLVCWVADNFLENFTTEVPVQ